MRQKFTENEQLDIGRLCLKFIKLCISEGPKKNVYRKAPDDSMKDVK